MLIAFLVWSRLLHMHLISSAYVLVIICFDSYLYKRVFINILNNIGIITDPWIRPLFVCIYSWSILSIKSFSMLKISFMILHGVFIWICLFLGTVPNTLLKLKNTIVWKIFFVFSFKISCSFNIFSYVV